VRVPAGGERVIVVQATPKTRETVGEPHPYDIEFKGVVEGVDESDPMAAAMAALLVRQGRYTYHPRFSALTMPRWVRRLPMWALILLLLLLLLLLSLAGNAAAAALGKPGAPHAHTRTPLASVAHPTRPAAATTVAARAITGPLPRPTKAAGTAVAGAAPRINRFAVQVGRDGSMVLAWAVAHAGTVFINGCRVGAAGLRTLHLTKATTFVLTVIGPGGASTQELQVVPGTSAPIVLPVSQVTRSLPTIEQFTAGTDSASGGLALTWTVSGATSVTLNGTPVGAASSKRIALGDHTIYVLRATNSQGTIVETITLPQQTPRQTVTRVVLCFPTIPRFALTHDSATDAYTLVWSTSGATGVTLNGSTVAASGSFTPPLPLQNGTYVLVASNQDGSTTARVNVVVQQVAPSARVYTIAAPRIVTFALRRINGKLYIVWQVSGASRVTLQGKSVPSSGQMEVPAGTTLSSIRLTATSDAGNAQQELLLPRPLGVAPSTATPRPAETATAIPSTVATVAPTAMSIQVATGTTPPTATARPLPSATAAPRASATDTPRPTDTPTRTVTRHVIALPAPSATHTPRPSATPSAPPLPAASATRTPLPAASATLTPLPAPALLGSFSATPAGVTFGAVLIGSDAARTVMVTNGGPGNLSLIGAAITGANSSDFIITTNGCLGIALAPGASCAITLTFTPGASGPRGAALTIDDNAPGGPHSVSLSGTGITRGLNISTGSLSFGAQHLGTTSGVKTVTLTNSGTDPVAVDAITVDGLNSGDYVITSTCGPTLAPAASCAITVSFAPGAIGSRTATLRVFDNAPGSPQGVGLSGAGVNPRAGMSASSLSFSDQLVGAVSTPKTVTLTNIGTTDLSVYGVRLEGANPGDYGESDTCTGIALAQGASCQIVVTFRPTAIGGRAADLHIDDDDVASPQHVALNGNGINPVILLTPSTFAFGDQSLHTPSAPHGITVKNNGATPLGIGSIVVSGPDAGDFTANAAGCPASLDPGASCTVNVIFTPGATGPRTASLVITDNAGSSPHSVPLSGNGINPTADLSPGSLTFGEQQLGTTSASRVVTLTNNGTTSLAIGSIVGTGPNAGDFLVTSTCGATVAAGGNCAISVSFTPSAIGTRHAAVTVTDNAATGGGTQSVQLSGAGINPIAALTPGALTFTDQPLGGSSAAKTVLLSNTGTTDLRIGGISIVGANPGDFILSGGTCGATVAAGTSCVITVAFAPTAILTRAAIVQVIDNAPGGTQSVMLTGNGINPIATFGAATLDFGPHYIPDPELGVHTVTQTVALTNTGTTPLIIGGVTVGGANQGDFTLSSTCGASLAPGAACVISVAFSPTAIGDRTASVIVTDNAAAGGGTQTVPLHGVGINPQGQPNPGTVDFGAVTLGQSRTQPVTLTNTGTTALSISRVTIHGIGMGMVARHAQAVAAPAPFDDFSADTSACPETVAPGASCVIAVTFQPTHVDSFGPRTDLLEIDDNTQFNGGRQLESLIGQGLNQAPTVTPPSLQFGGVPTGVSSTQLLTVTNPGSADLHISTIYVDGPAAGDFGLPAGSSSALPACSTSTPLGPGASCVIGVSFTPSITGTRTATLHLSDDAVGSPQQIQLGGTGTDSRVGFSPPSLSFDHDPYALNTQPVAVSDTVTQTITLSSTGTTPLTVGTITLSDPHALGYSESDNCQNRTIPAGQTCTITVTLTSVTSTNDSPDAAASLRISDDSRDGSAQTITLSATTARPTTYFGGTGYSQDITFANTLAGTSSATQTVSLNNSPSEGPSPELLIPANAVTLSGPNAADFTINADDCSGAPGGLRRIDPGSGCGVTVSFTPQSGATGTVSATLTYNDNASNAPQLVTLYGTVATRIRIRPSIVDTFYPCGSQGEFTAPCETRVVTVTNIGSATLTVTNVTDPDGHFNVDPSGCTSAAIPVGGTCAINVALTNNQQPISGTDRLIITSNGIDTNGHDSPQIVPLEWSDIAVSPHGLDFGSVSIGTGSVTQTVTVNDINNFNGVTIMSATVVGVSPDDNPGDFAIVPGGDGCSGRTLQADGSSSCQITVAFTPTASGPRRADLLISDTDTPLPHDVTLDGTGTGLGASLTPSSHFYQRDQEIQGGGTSAQDPGVAVGEPAPPYTYILNAFGTEDVQVSNIALAGPNAGDFTIVTSAGSCQAGTLAHGTSCPITVAFTPTALGPVSAMLLVYDNAPGSPQTVALTSYGLQPLVAYYPDQPFQTPTPVTFDPVIAGAVGATRPISLENYGGNGDGALADLVIPSRAVTITGANAGSFSLDSDGCSGRIVATFDSCAVGVSFRPPTGSSGTITATLVITDNAQNAPQVLTLQGTAYPTRVKVRPGILDLHSPFFTSSTVAATTVTNMGPGVLGPVTPTVSDATDFQVSGNDCRSGGIAVGASCVISVTLTTTGTAGAPNTTIATVLRLDDNALGRTVLDSGEGNPQYVDVQRTPVVVPPLGANFGAAAQGTGVTQTITVSAQQGTGPYTVTNVSIGGDDPQDYQIVTDQCTGHAVMGTFPNCTVTVGFTPTQPMTRSAELLISDTVSPFRHDITLDGFGVAHSARVAYLASLAAQQSPAPNPAPPASIETPAATSTPLASAVSPVALTTPTPTPTTTDSPIAVSATPTAATATATATATASPMPAETAAPASTAIATPTPTATATAIATPTATATPARTPPSPTDTASPPGSAARAARLRAYLAAGARP